MRFDRFTLKAQECIQTAQQAADKYGHQQIEPEHLLRAVLDQKEGVVPPLLGKIGANREHLLQGTDSLLERMSSVSGGGAGQAYISPRTKSVLDRAFQEAEQMKDEYVSLEHILLAILEEKDSKAAKILAASGVTKEAIL